MLKEALNSLARLHSRVGQLRRLGSPDIYTPCRLMPSSYFRFLAGPDTTSIQGREFVIPIDSLLGQFTQSVAFSIPPTAGGFKLTYNNIESNTISSGDSTATVQTTLRLVTGLENVLVTGSPSTGYLFTFQGFSSAPLALTVSFSDLTGAASAAVTTTMSASYLSWTTKIKRSDKIIDSVYGQLTITDIIDMPDVGGSTMAFRVRCE